MSAEYLAIDVETGGIPDETSLLTIYIGGLDKDFKLVDELDIAVKPADGMYKVNAEALQVNGINLIAHDKVAVTYEQAKTLIYNFLQKVNPDGNKKLIPVGHNVAFDIRRICSDTLSKKSWDKFVGYRTLDSGGISIALITAGKLPQMKASLGSLAEYFGIKFEAHTAKGDAIASAEVVKELLRIIAA